MFADFGGGVLINSKNIESMRVDSITNELVVRMTTRSDIRIPFSSYSEAWDNFNKLKKSMTELDATDVHDKLSHIEELLNVLIKNSTST